MSMPSPFELGKAVSENISGAFKERRDQTALDKILEHAMNSENSDAVIGQLLSRVSPEKQQLALSIIKSQQEKLKKNKVNAAYQNAGLDPNLPEGINKAIINKKGAASNPFQAQTLKNESNEFHEIPTKFNEYTDLIKDLTEMRELTSKTGALGTSVFSPEKSNRYKALQNKITLNRAQLQKGAQSDKDMALLLGETGKIGQIGGVKVFDNLIKRAEENLQRVSNRGQELYEKYQEQGATKPPMIPVQKSVKESQEAIFKNEKSAEFVNQSGTKVKIQKGNDKQIIAALSQGYAPEGYVAMLAPDGYPDMVPVEEVQNELNKGSIVIYGQ